MVIANWNEAPAQQHVPKCLNALSLHLSPFLDAISTTTRFITKTCSFIKLVSRVTPDFEIPLALFVFLLGVLANNLPWSANK